MKPARNPSFLRELTDSNRLLVAAAGESPERAAEAWKNWSAVNTSFDLVAVEERVLLATVAWNLQATVSREDLALALQVRRKVAASNLLAVSRLRVVLSILAETGITPLLLKGGALLSSACYDDLAARRMADFDLLVSREEADATLDALERNGQVRFGSDEFELRTIRSVMHAAALQGPLGELDIHWTLLHQSRIANADHEVLTTASKELLGGLTISVPAPEQLAFHLLAHGRLPDLRWLVDANHFVQRNRVDPGRVAELARDRLYLTVVRHNLALLVSVLPNARSHALLDAANAAKPKRGDQLHMEFTDAVEAGQRARALVHFASRQLRTPGVSGRVEFVRELARFATGAPSAREAIRRLSNYALLGRTRADSTKAP